MPVPMRKAGAGGDGGESVQLLERELGKLRREMETLRRDSNGESHRGATIAWVALAVGVMGLIAGVLGLLRH
jgi:hypothetical protein